LIIKENDYEIINIKNVEPSSVEPSRVEEEKQLIEETSITGESDYIKL
jgi:hypothetical protein